jgi:multiple sugar transport system permease protein
VGTRKGAWGTLGTLRSLLRPLYNARWAYFFLAPAYLFFAVFILYPLLQGLFLSFFKVGLGPERTFVGLGNFIRLAQDPKFTRAVGNTFVFVLGVVPLALAISLSVALLIYPLSQRVQTFFRMAFYLPTVASGVILAMVWLWIYQPTYGLLNYLLGLIGLPRIAWLGSTEWALPALALVVLSWILGQPIILFIAALGAIPPELTDAAMMDGAGSLTLLRRVTLPLLRPTVLFVLLTQTIGVLQTVVVVIVMTRGGPANATQTIVYRIYETAFDFYEFGYASAMGVVLLLIVAIIAVIQFRVLGQQVEY